MQPWLSAQSRSVTFLRATHAHGEKQGKKFQKFNGHLLIVNVFVTLLERMSASWQHAVVKNFKALGCCTCIICHRGELFFFSSDIRKMHAFVHEISHNKSISPVIGIGMPMQIAC